ncbi:MAG: hypothetical protein L6R42_008556, partial [Xanthoria sp. 1 TBL-2021]
TKSERITLAMGDMRRMVKWILLRVGVNSPMGTLLWTPRWAPKHARHRTTWPLAQKAHGASCERAILEMK